jgi:beta-mannanase
LSDSTHTGQWWAPSSKHAKRTALGTAAIVIALSLITWTVWASPSNPVSTAVHHALGVDTAAEKTAKKAATAEALQAKLDAAQKQIWKLQGQLQSANASGASRADQIANLQQQLSSAQSSLGQAKAQALAASASGSKASGSGSGGGSGHGGSGAHVASTKPAATGNSGPSKNPTSSTPAAPTKAEVLAQQSRWYGLYTAQSPFNWAEYDQVSKQVGTATNMDGYFQGFDQAFNASAVQRSWANGRLPVMTWETTPSQSGNDAPYIPGYTNADIMNPAKFGTYIKDYADAIAANGQPMVIRFDHEMNGSWYNWSEDAQNPADGSYPNAKGSYVAMWQYVHDIFQAEGANDYVIWDWSPTRIDDLSPNKNSVKLSQAHMDVSYPGDEYVDWVGMSGYYRKSTTAPTFDTTFGATLAQLRALPHTTGAKPIFLAEVGATETGGTGQKAKWMTSLFDSLAQPSNDDIIGFAYFSEVATTYVDGVRSTNDWRLNSRADSLAAFVAGIKRTDTDFDLQEVTP